MDLDAPILPGVAAAGISLGLTREELLAQATPLQIVPLRGAERLEFGPVRVWVWDGRVHQVGVGAGYRGALAEKIRNGSTLREVEAAFGPVEEDDEDNLIVPGFPAGASRRSRGSRETPRRRIRKRGLPRSSCSGRRVSPLTLSR